MYHYLGEHHVQIFFTLTGEQLVPPRKSTLQTLHDGILLRTGVRNSLVELGHKVWWIFDSTSREIESPNLQVEGWVKPQEVLDHTLKASV